jgi:hypothetical protein
MTDLTRRRALAAAAWTAPAIVVASAAPAYAGSMVGAPGVVVSDVGGRLREGTDRMEAHATFTNAGTVDATFLSAEVEWDPILLGSTRNDVQDLPPGWTFEELNATTRVRFTKAAGLAAGVSETLTWNFQILRQDQRGTMTVDPPVTMPAGNNTGATGVYGQTEPIDIDVTSVTKSPTTGIVVVAMQNRGTLPGNPTVRVTVTPATGTVGFSGVVETLGWVADPMAVAPSTDPMVIEFTSAAPLAPTVGTSLRFSIDETGTGEIAATVSSPDNGLNSTETEPYG